MSPTPLPAPTFDMRTLALHHERLRAFAVALLGDEHAAEDALQDVWMRAMRGGPREPGALGASLRTTARRVVQNHRRGAARRRDRERLAARDESLPSSASFRADCRGPLPSRPPSSGGRSS